MNGMTDIHPDAVMEQLLAKGNRSDRRAKLAQLHEICRKQHGAGSRDFSLGAVGRLAEADGILKGRALYNAPSADYRSLIEAWAAYAGPPPAKAPKTLASHDYLIRIEDPAIRSIMQSVIAERDKLKAQVNLLKANTQVTIDRRPTGVPAAPDAQSVTVLALSAQLTPSEREALQKAVSAEYLEARGLREGSHGEIVNDSGRAIFDVGFTRAIRKVLGTEPKRQQ